MEKSMGKKVNNQKGFTLVEMVMVIAVMGVLVIGAVVIFKKSMVKQNVNDEISTITEITSAVQKHYYSKAVYTGLTNTIATSFKLVPDSMIGGVGTINNRWSGTVTLAPATVNTTDDAFTFTTTLVPTDACLGAGIVLAPQYTAASVAGTVVKAAGAALNEGTLATQCASAASVTMVYTVSK